AWSDEAGFDAKKFYLTFRLADVTGDGRDDVCIRAAAGIRCAPSTGDGFGEIFAGPALSDDSGWSGTANYGTLRFGDIDGDGDADLCARADAGMRCWRSTGSGFESDAIAGPAWSDDAGWDVFSSWSTIALVDLDDDGRADLCGRAPDAVYCALSTGDGFGPGIQGPALADDSGWDEDNNFMTLQWVDIDDNGTLDLCGRANAGMYCWPFDGSAFGDAQASTRYSDESGWDDMPEFASIQMADINGDGFADVC